eukprot:GFUD01077067.1.p1 GENE.GFUD01077067.1~~GFUD01077067.1.p1  ORF type:complete len:299 (+),score=46.36 GFUD01077067.1:111-1007(+)
MMKVKKGIATFLLLLLLGSSTSCPPKTQEQEKCADGHDLSEEFIISRAVGFAVLGVCAAISGFFCSVTGITCLISAGCGAGARISFISLGINPQICSRRKRSLNSKSSPQDVEHFMLSRLNPTEFQSQIDLMNLMESIEDMATVKLDKIHSLVKGTDLEKPVNYILNIDQVYKAFEKTAHLKLIKADESTVEEFGNSAKLCRIHQQTIANILIGNNSVYKENILIGNNAVYKEQSEFCREATFDAIETVLLKGSFYYFMGQKLVENIEPSALDIAVLKDTLEKHRIAIKNYCMIILVD